MSNLNNVSKFFHQSSKNHDKGHPPVSSNMSEWPEEWKTTYYKNFPRFPKINLTDNIMRADFFELIKKRQSQRNFTRQPLSKNDISLLLKYSCGIIREKDNGQHSRAQPSGGARFPIEVYPIIFHSSKELQAGVYHYNVKEHKLDVLLEREFNDFEIKELFNYSWTKDAAIGIVMTAVFWRTQNKYGERGYRYTLLEAGHIGQNIYLISEALGIQCCAHGGTRDENIEKLLNIDGTTESVVYGLAIGK